MHLTINVTYIPKQHSLSGIFSRSTLFSVSIELNLIYNVGVH